MTKKDVLLFFDLDQTLNRFDLDIKPKEPAVSRDFWNELHKKATIVLITKRPSLLAHPFVKEMQREGWLLPDLEDDTWMNTKIHEVEKLISKFKPKKAIFVGNSKDDCMSALANGCECIRFTMHDKHKLPEGIGHKIFESSSQKEIEKKINKIIAS